MKILKPLDLFGSSINFRIFGEEYYHNSISYISSLLTIIITITFTFCFGLDFIFHSEPRILQSMKINKINDYVNLPMKDFFFAWHIEDINGSEINYTNFLFPSFTYYTYETNDEIKIKFQKCKNFTLSNNIPNDINDNYFCSNLSQYSFGGDWQNENKIEYFKLNINLCDKINCPSKNDLIGILNNYGELYLSIFYPTIYFIPEDEIPFQIGYKKLKIFLDPDLSKINKIYIHKYIFETDVGWIFAKKEKNIAYGIENIESYNSKLTKNDSIEPNSYISSCLFYLDRNYSIYKRRYTKIYESLSNIYAFYKLLYIIFYSVSSLCNKFLLYELIIEKSNIKSTKTMKRSNVLDLRGSFNMGLNSSSINKSYNKSINRSINKSINKSSINNKSNISNNSNAKIIINKNYLALPNTQNNYNRNRLSIFQDPGTKEIKVPEHKNVEKDKSQSSPKRKIHDRLTKNNKKYKYLCFYLFPCFLSTESKNIYQAKKKKREDIFKKIDIDKYLSLVVKVDYLYNQTKKNIPNIVIDYN